MKKAPLTLVAVLWAISSLLAQQVDYNKIILPDGAQNVSFEERLVQLAWKNNPDGIITVEEITLAKEEFKSTRASWTQNFGVAGNLNEFSIDRTVSGNDDPNNRNQFFPRYNFYGRLPLSMLFQDPHEKKVAASKVKIAQNRVNQKKLELRATVLSLYQDVKLNESIWVIKQQTMADEESNFLLIEQRFKNGEAQVDEYIRAQRSRNDLKIQLAVAETDYIKSKLALEEIIGVRLEDVK